MPETKPKQMCPKCNNFVWSALDLKYISLFGNCWMCDEKNYQEKGISLKEFNSRESKALELAIK